MLRLHSHARSTLRLGGIGALPSIHVPRITALNIDASVSSPPCCTCASRSFTSSAHPRLLSITRTTLPLSNTSVRHFASMTAAKRKAKADKLLLERYGFNPLNYKVSIFGRPNVGKSTLFNRLVGRHVAIVDSKPGVTRDRRDADASIGELEFRIIDTAGLEEIQKFLLKDKHEYQLINNEPMNQDLQRGMIQQTEQALQECDVALFVIDGREGITPLDRYFAKWLRRQCRTTTKIVDPVTGKVSHQTINKPVVLLANKCDNYEQAHSYFGLTEGYELGFGEPVAISADHAGGMSDLHNALYDAFLKVHDMKQAAFPAREKAINDDLEKIDEIQEIKLAIVGKVNAGKSTLINTLLGQTRVLTGSQPGVTRDPIEVDWRDEKEEQREMKRKKMELEEKEKKEEIGEVKQLTASSSESSSPTDPTPSSATESPVIPSYRFKLIDTAGLKGVTPHSHSKYGRVDEMSMGLTLRSIERANVVALVIDIGEAGLEGVRKSSEVEEEKKGKKGKATEKPKPLGMSAQTSALASSSSSTAPALLTSPTITSGLLFREGKKYTEVERSQLLRTYVRNVFSSNDLAIAAKILNEGRALVIVLNKFDLISSDALRQQILEGVHAELNSSLSMAGTGLTVIGISGQKSYDLYSGQALKSTLRQAVIRTYEKWNSRISTHRLNSFLSEVIKFNPPPQASPLRKKGGELKHRKISMKFIQQVSARPPTFVIFTNRAGEEMNEEYKRFIINSLRKEFDLGGTPVRLFVRVRKNPFVTEGGKKKMKSAAVKATNTEVESFADKNDEAVEDEEVDEDEEDEDDDAEFNESDYSPISRFDREVQFSYDAHMHAAARTSEGREELRRELLGGRISKPVAKSVKTSTPATAAASSVTSSPTMKSSSPSSSTKSTAKSSPSSTTASLRTATINSPIPRVVPTSKTRASTHPSSSSSSSAIFASTQKVKKPQRRTKAAFAWSIQSKPGSIGAAKYGKHGAGVVAQGEGKFLKKSELKKKLKQEGKGKEKKVKISGNFQSARVVKAIQKANEHQTARKEASAKRKLAKQKRKAGSK